CTTTSCGCSTATQDSPAWDEGCSASPTHVASGSSSRPSTRPRTSRPRSRPPRVHPARCREQTDDQYQAVGRQGGGALSAFLLHGGPEPGVQRTPPVPPVLLGRCRERHRRLL